MRKEISSFFRVKSKKRIIFLSSLLVVLFIIVNAFFIYFNQSDNYYFFIVKKLIPYPAFFIGKEYITVDKFDSEVKLNKKLYELSYKIDFSNSAEGRKNLKELKDKTKEDILETTIMQKVLGSIDKGVTKKEIKNEYDRTIKDIGSDKEIANILKYSANINEKDIQDKIQYALLKNKVKENILYGLKLKIIAIKTLDINNTQDWEVARLKAEKVVEQSRGNQNFYNNFFALDNDKNDLIVQNFGNEYYGLEDLPTNFRDTFLTLLPNQISNPLKTELGYYILKNEGQRGYFKGTFAEFIKEQKEKTKVISFLH